MPNQKTSSQGDYCRSKQRPSLLRAGRGDVKSWVMLNLDRDADAISDFDRALVIGPEFPGAYY